MLRQNGIRLPIYVGMAGPTPLTKLIKFAVICGIGNSLRSVMRSWSPSAGIMPLATRPDQHLMRLVTSPLPTRIVALHFYSFGGALETARWMKQVVAGEYDLVARADHFTVHH